MVERRAINPSEAIKKERLSDAEMGNLLAAIGNHEAKALTLCLMTPGMIYPKGDLHRAVIRAQGQRKGWRIAYAGPFQYCKDSLSPIGLVAHEVINSDLSTYGYMKTEYGETIGVPLAGLLLDFSLRHPDLSLQDVFSTTASRSRSQKFGDVESKKRSPITRLKIFWEILTSSLPIRTVDIAKRIGEERVAGVHLSELADKGIISYESVKHGEASVFYRLSETPPSSEPEPYRGSRSLTSFICQLLRQDRDQEWSMEAINERYQQYREANAKPVRDVKKLKSAISSVLSHLAKKGYARRRKFIGRQILSEVALTEGQREVFLDLVTLLDRFQNQDPAILEFGKRLASGIIANPEKVSLLLAKAKEHSSHVSALPTEETAGDILRIVSSCPGSTTQQIREVLKREERRLSKSSINAIVKSLIIASKITPSLARGVRHFSLANNPQ